MINDEMLSLKQIQNFLKLKNLPPSISKETGLCRITILKIRNKAEGNYTTKTLKLLSNYIKKQLESLES